MSAVFGAWQQVEQCPVLVALEELIEALHEPRHERRVGLADLEATPAAVPSRLPP